jgi:membrane protease YdiL (CAAX protease family)
VAIRYSRAQLVIAKLAVIALLALILGPQLAEKPSEQAISILVVLAMVGGAVAVYEVLSHGLALAVARLWPRPAAPDSDADSDPTSPLITPNALQTRHVLSALGAYLAAQALVWIGTAIVVISDVGLSAKPEAFTRALASYVSVALPASVIAGCIALLLVLRDWRRRMGPAALNTLLGLSWGTTRQIVTGLAGGAALSILVFPLLALVSDDPASPDPVSQLVITSESARWAWIVSAVLLAPPVEEVMFRGVLLGGLSETWSVRAAALVSGGTFWLMHAPEWAHWPAAVAIGLLTIVVTRLRLRTGAVGPSMAVHFAYNLMLALALVASPRAGVLPSGPEESRWAQAVISP